MAINPLGKTLSFTYDSLKHLSAVNLQGIYNRSYTYKALSGSRSSNLVSKVDYTQNGNSNFSRLEDRGRFCVLRETSASIR